MSLIDSDAMAILIHQGDLHYGPSNSLPLLKLGNPLQGGNIGGVGTAGRERRKLIRKLYEGHCHARLSSNTQRSYQLEASFTKSQRYVPRGGS